MLGVSITMPALAAQKIAIVGRLVETSPDRVLSNLRRALAETVDDSALGDVRRLVEAEVSERQFRNAVMAPVAPMFAVSGRVRPGLTFPPQALGLIWRGLKTAAGSTVADIRKASEEEPPRQGLAGRYDGLVEAAANGLRSRSNADFVEAADLCDRSRPDGTASLVACLDIAPVVRRAIARLPVWLAHPGDSSAPARLAYNDAVAVNDAAGPAYFEMIAAQLDQDWMVLRIIAAVMDKPSERYLADTDLGGFTEAVMAEVDDAVSLIDTFDAHAGTEGGHEVAQRAELAVRQIMEIENSVALNRQRGWGRRVHKQRLALASAVEGRLREADLAVTVALPLHETLQNGLRRLVPCLSMAPVAANVSRADTLLAFSAGLRSAVNYGGFSAARGALIEKLGVALDLYVDEAVQQIRSDPAREMVYAGDFLEIAARFSALVLGDQAGDLVRRRAQAALHPQPQIAAYAE